MRRGASRANSVRFDVSALQSSSWTQGSRNFGEYGPARPSSGLGSHPMTERSLSHKSDGRHSSAGHSVHSMHSVPSGRTSSLGLDTNFLVGDQHEDSPIDIVLPPPGLFILGSVPSIIRCWLTTNFSHDALLYGVVCTGSHRSALDYSLVKELNLLNRIQKSSMGRDTIRLPLCLPEAIIKQPSSRSNSPAPQLPTLTTDFEIVDLTQSANSTRKTSIQVFLGSDTLRAHNADILFSQNVMTLYDDDHNKISVPFARPEDENLFKNLCTTNLSPENNELKSTTPHLPRAESRSKVGLTPATVSSALRGDTVQVEKTKSSSLGQRSPAPNDDPLSPFISTPTSDTNNLSQLSDTKGLGYNDNTSDSEKARREETPVRGSDMSDDTNPADAPRNESSGGIWGSWRSAAGGSDNGETTSGYQRPTRGGSGRNMKVLKPSKSISAANATRRSSSSARTSVTYEPAPSRVSGEIRRKSHGVGNENPPMRRDSKNGSDDQKAAKSIATLSRSSNPVGGASAFAWMNPGKSKASASAE